MFRSLKRLFGSRLAASDGDIGPVKDFYFDDQNWAVRYLVADSSAWLPGRRVLISPYALELTKVGKLSVMSLTRKQVESSPLFQPDQPISRAYEERYHRYYGWPFYWHGHDLWGFSGFPITPLPERLPGELIASASGRPTPLAEPQLRSTQVVKTYALRTCDGVKGHLCDFLMDDRNWAICQLVVKTGRRFSGQEVEIPVTTVDGVSNEHSTVFLNLSREALEQSPEHESSPLFQGVRIFKASARLKRRRVPEY